MLYVYNDASAGLAFVNCQNWFILLEIVEKSTHVHPIIISKYIKDGLDGFISTWSQRENIEFSAEIIYT